MFKLLNVRWPAILSLDVLGSKSQSVLKTTWAEFDQTANQSKSRLKVDIALFP